MFRLATVLSLLIMLSGCTAIVDKVTDEPFRPDPTGKSAGKNLSLIHI